MKNVLSNVNENYKEIKNVQELLKAAGLDWKVEQQEVFLKDNVLIPNTKANVRLDTGVVLGIVSDSYKPVQNDEAFDFVNNITKDITFENAFEFNNGKSIYLQADLDKRYITALNDVTDCKLVFKTSHDGKGSVRVHILPIIDGTVLNLKGSVKRDFNAIHSKSIEKKMATAKNTLDLARNYLEYITGETLKLRNIEISKDLRKRIIEKLIPMGNDLSDRAANTVETRRQEIDTYIKGDNALMFILGVSNYVNNADARRKTTTYEKARYAQVTNGSPLVDKAYELILANI